jgi:uncharacterized protein
MTPQEQALIDELFDRLASLENNPRDPEAERAIVDGLRRAPHAAYALVQTALVQDEALRRADARIQELEAQFGGEQEQHQGSFLDTMREAVLGRREPRGSVPSVRSSAPQPPPMDSSMPPWSTPPGSMPPSSMPPSSMGPPPMSPMGSPPFGSSPGYYPQMPTGPAFGSGGSFLGTAASTAAGVIGGALLMDGIRSMFGHHGGTGAQSAFDRFNDRPSVGAGSSSDSNLAREAGINDIDRGGSRQGAADYRQQDVDQQELNRQQDLEQDMADDAGGDDGDYGGDDSDFA